MRTQWLLFLILAGLSSACLEKPVISNESLTAIDEEAFLVDSSLQSINDLDDEPSSDVSGLQKVVVQPCNVVGSESFFEVEYSDHSRPNGAVLNGSSLASFNNSSCSLLITGDEVIREHQLKLVGFYSRAYINSSSSEKTNYLGQSVGGGRSILTTNSGWTVENLGENHQLVNSNGRTLMDISVQTSQPIVVEGSLARDNRKVVSGETKIFHNLARFTTTLTYSNLQWDASCECPISGSIAIDREGSVEIDSNVTFLTCGQVSFEYPNGRTVVRQLPRCL